MQSELVELQKCDVKQNVNMG